MTVSETEGWPPSFTLDQEKILNLLTGDRFYSNASAALREVILNAIDATYRRSQSGEAGYQPEIIVSFDSKTRSLSVADNGDGMDRTAVSNLFTRVGASAAQAEATKRTVGEFGIGVISYFMAGHAFTVHTFDGSSQAIGLKFTRQMLAGGPAQSLEAARTARGTTVQIEIRDQETFELLLKSFPHWCRDVAGLTASTDGTELRQGGSQRQGEAIALPTPDWVEGAHLSAVSGVRAWDTMSGTSTISILYRGVFVQEFSAHGLWGIQGSIDVDPKYFKPKLNRESFVEGAFQSEVAAFLKSIHPKVLETMAVQLSEALDRGDLDKWTQLRWATLWLSIPRDGNYANAATLWDRIFRKIPAFELAVGNNWEPISLEGLLALRGPIYVAPLPEEQKRTTDIVKAALRLLRHTKEPVIRGLRPDRSWLQDVGNSFGTTADLIRSVFASELPELIPLTDVAEKVVAGVPPVVTLYAGTPSVDIVKIGADSPPILRIQSRLIINLEHATGKAIVREALAENTGRWSLISITARHSQEHISQVAAAVRDSPHPVETLGLVKRRFIERLLT